MKMNRILRHHVGIKMTCVRYAIAAICLSLCIGPPMAIGQDWTDANFTLWHEFGSKGTNDGQFMNADGITVDEAGYIYVSDYSLHRIQVFQADGTFVRKWGSQGSGTYQFNNPRGLDIGPDGNLYVCDWGNHRVMVFQPDGTYVTNWGSYGSGELEFNHPYRISVNKLNHIAIADYDNKRVQIISSQGDFIRQFEVRNHCNELTPPVGILIQEDGVCFVTYKYRTTVGRTEGYIRRYSSNSEAGVYACLVNTTAGTVSVEPYIMGCLLVSISNGYGYPYESYISSWLDRLQIMTEGFGCKSGPHTAKLRNIAAGPDGTIFGIQWDYRSIAVYRWLRRTAGQISNKLAFWCTIENVQQRSGFPYLDVDYRVVSDIGITNAEVAMCAFLDGSNKLTKLIPMRTFVENTGTNLGHNIAVGTDVKRVTWDMSTDWKADSGNVQIQAFAQEGPYYLDFHWLTIPAGGGVSHDFVICRTPVTDNDLKPAWMFLVARNDPDIVLSNGVVYGVSGTYKGQKLASDSGTTASGYAFLWNRMNLREPTAEELQRAKEGTIPGIQKWNPRFQVGGRPYKINEFGLDTGATAGYWAVKK